ncbi:restriction endonuclease subunit S [Enterobacter sp. 262D3]|uniref:restriction endonuclease subunit S n=1 Tax=Enterobacter sp. 262D3 TaxID=3077763 RepID=UPI002A8052E4|nr:restriction endonuclease subunit S [Enterobacter sp. 262D3]
MQHQLQQLEQDYGIAWREYRLEELFGKASRGRRLKSSDRIEGTLPFVTAGEANTGISAWIGNDVEVFSKNTITIDMFGSAKYRNYEYGADDHVAVVHTEHLPSQVVMYITAAVNKSSHAGQFDYSRNFYASDADELVIQLPIINSNGKTEIAFDFMNTYIATLKTERFNTLNAYLRASGLNDYILTESEQATLNKIETVPLGAFKIKTLFEKLNLKNNNPSFEKFLDTSTFPTGEFNLPLVNAKLGNNGIMFYGREEDFDSAEMTIDVVSNGAVATGTVYAQPYKTGVLWDAYLLKPIVNDINKEKLLYLATSLQKSIRTKFGWEDKAVWSKVQHEIITLPIKPDNTPDYDFMADFVKAMQKVVIKNVVDYVNQTITAQQQVVTEG